MFPYCTYCAMLKSVKFVSLLKHSSFLYGKTQNPSIQRLEVNTALLACVSILGQFAPADSNVHLMGHRFSLPALSSSPWPLASSTILISYEINCFRLHKGVRFHGIWLSILGLFHWSSDLQVLPRGWKWQDFILYIQRVQWSACTTVYFILFSWRTLRLFLFLGYCQQWCK